MSPAVLVARAQAGDVDAFASLAREHAAMMFRVAIGVVGNDQDAQDVTQQALLSAWQGLASFRGDAAFGTWLHQIVRRHALNWVSRQRPTVLLPEGIEPVDDASDPAALAVAHETDASLRAAVRALPAAQRRAVVLFHFQQLSYTEIAAASSCSEPSVRSHLFRARRTLAHSLDARR